MRVILALFATVLLASCGEQAAQPDTRHPESATVLTVKGMSCSGCEATIMKALSKVEGVEEAQVEHEAGRVAYSGPAKKAEVVTAIRRAGYEVIE